ncbi:DMT family transporter [Vibrio metschnikovii]|uniref:DMT family transporter n=1 Tax=Vibrio metschnikovii TaxID=28172 RepID=UPI00164441C8|nr:DMT family transporter [Vibrio metschnikovii]MBC3616110.1 DMT family transporter [Vibrio metschnikovii]MBC5812122.1 DMT family transporter [Vibrio metschnikovii]MBC5831706.1 DMT family transporter [Vibrio metschnikovii]
MFIKMIPFLFVILWSSGFVGARYGLTYAEPMTLLSLRMLLTVLLFGGLLALFKRQSIPKGKALWHASVAGLLIHGLYLGGTYQAIYWGMPAGLTSLLVGTQPVMTVLLLVIMTPQRFTVSQWIGLGIGFVGISLVLLGNLEWQSEEKQWAAVGMCILSLFGITVGTLYQKRFCQQSDLLGGTLVQYMAASILFIPLALKVESMSIQWTTTFVLTMVWLVVVLSCVAVLLLLYMVEHGASSNVASIFYLVPPTTAIQAWFAFDELLDGLGILGFILTALAVYFVVKKPKLWGRKRGLILEN